MLSLYRYLQFWKEKKVSGCQDRWIWWLRHDYRIIFGQKLIHTHLNVRYFINSVHFWRIVSRNRRITSRKYSLFTVIFVARIHNAPRHSYWRKQWVIPLRLTELDLLFSVWAILYASIGMVSILKPYIHDSSAVMTFLTNLHHCWTSSTSPEQYPCDVVFA